MSAPPYQPGTPAPSAHPDPPDPTRHLNAPPYPLGGRPPMQPNAADQQQPTISQSQVSDTQGHNQLGGAHRSSAYPNQLQSTYDSSASGYHAQGQVTNSLNIDPALLAMGQGGRQQPTLQQFNMNGAHVTFAAHSFPHNFGPNAFQQSSITQGNQNLRQEGTEPPANNADQMNVDAHIFDTSAHDFNDNSFLSKYELDPTMSAYGLDSFDNKLKDSRLMPPPPLPPKVLAHSLGNNDIVVFAQHGGDHQTVSPDVFNPELTNSGEGHSIGITSAMQESSGDSRPSVSPTKKRGRSSSDEDSSNVRIEGSHKPQLPPAPRKRARMSQSSGSSAYVSSSDSQESISLSRRESLLAADYSNVKLASGPLQGMSPEEAADLYIKRVALNISGIDNFNEVKAEREKWIRAIMQAFDDPYNNAPKTKTVDLEEFQRWQKEHHALTMEVFDEDPTGRLLEAIATHLYNQVVGGHQKGSLVKSSGNSFRHDDKLKCKERLENIIKALTGLAIIRYDLATGARVHELVANPDAVFKRKEENKLENDRKKIKKDAADAAKATKNKNAADAFTEENVKTNASNIAKAGNKGRGKSKPAIVEEDEESDEPSNSEALPSSAPNVSTSIPEPEPVDDESDYPWRRRPGHRRTGVYDGVFYESSSGPDDPL